MSSDRRYTQDEVDAILKRAIERDGSRGSLGSNALTHQDLLDTAREVGIEPAQLDTAIAEVKRDQKSLALKDEWKARKQKAMARRLTIYAFVNAICIAVNLLTWSHPWFQWVLVPWGLVLFFRYLMIRNGPSDSELLKLQKRLDREEKKRLMAARFERGAKAISSVVEQGADLLLSHIEEQQKRLEARSPQERPGPLPPKR